MKNKILIILTIIFFGFTFAQSGRVGINTVSPKSTLDVTGKTDTSGNLLPTDITGLQAPRLTLEELTNKGNSLYGADQKGTLVYITDISAGDTASQRINITSTGYYYFDGSVWIKIGGATLNNEPWNVANTTTQATQNSEDIYQMGKVGINVNNPSSNMTVNGSIAGNYQQKSATTYTISANDFYLSFNGNANGTWTLPAATAAYPTTGNTLGRIYHIKNTNPLYSLVVKANGSELIDTGGITASSITIYPGGYAFIVSKGTIGSVTTWEASVLVQSIVISMSNTVSPSTMSFTGTALTNFNNGIPQVIPFTTTDIAVNWGNAATWDNTNHCFNILTSGYYEINAMANFGSEDIMTTTGSGGKTWTGINIAVTKNGTAVSNIIGGARGAIVADGGNYGNTPINTNFLAFLNAGDKIYFTMYWAAGLYPSGGVNIRHPAGMVENANFSLKKL